MQRFIIGSNILIKLMVEKKKEGSKLILPDKANSTSIEHEDLPKYYDNNPFRGKITMLGNMVNFDINDNKLEVGDIITLMVSPTHGFPILGFPIIIDGEIFYSITRSEIKLVERGK